MSACQCVNLQRQPKPLRHKVDKMRETERQEKDRAAVGDRRRALPPRSTSLAAPLTKDAQDWHRPVQAAARASQEVARRTGQVSRSALQSGHSQADIRPSLRVFYKHKIRHSFRRHNKPESSQSAVRRLQQHNQVSNLRPPSSDSELTPRALQLLRQLQATNNGYLHSLTRTLNTAYGRIGKGKHRALEVSTPERELRAEHLRLTPPLRSHSFRPTTSHTPIPSHHFSQPSCSPQSLTPPAPQPPPSSRTRRPSRRAPCPAPSRPGCWASCRGRGRRRLGGGTGMSRWES